MKWESYNALITNLASGNWEQARMSHVKYLTLTRQGVMIFNHRVILGELFQDKLFLNITHYPNPIWETLQEKLWAALGQIQRKTPTKEVGRTMRLQIYINRADAPLLFRVKKWRQKRWFRKFMTIYGLPSWIEPGAYRTTSIPLRRPDVFSHA